MINKTINKYIFENESKLVKGIEDIISDYNLSPRKAKWLRTIYKEAQIKFGNEDEWVDYDGDLAQCLSWIDWYGPKDVTKLEYKAAWDNTWKWNENLKSAKPDKKYLGSIKELDTKLPNNLKLVRLLDQKAFEHEGRALNAGGGYGHICLYNDATKFKNKDNGMYSIRDKNNKPHVTICVIKGKIEQISGIGEHLPNKKYKTVIEYVLEHHLNFNISDNQYLNWR